MLLSVRALQNEHFEPLKKYGGWNRVTSLHSLVTTNNINMQIYCRIRFEKNKEGKIIWFEMFNLWHSGNTKKIYFNKINQVIEEFFVDYIGERLFEGLVFVG